ncbi:MAG: prolyl-tRNA synthetase associated domain-containing protein [Phycisphaerales bacterium]|nr:prolyl-tRNA synthetase associated domain-containing protein [Hyphomonadaceae bacterium]
MTAPPHAATPTDPASQADLFSLFSRLDIAHRTTQHRRVFTVEEGADLKAQMPGGHSKNLFLKDKKGRLFLLCALGDTVIDLNALSKLLAAGRVSFGSAQLLMEHLGVEPGSVTLFALINDPEHRVTLLLDEGLLAHDPVNFHPLRNDATTAISPSDMLKFIRALGREPVVLRFDPDGVPTRIEPGAPTAHLQP